MRSVKKGKVRKGLNRRAHDGRTANAKLKKRLEQLLEHWASWVTWNSTWNEKLKITGGRILADAPSVLKKMNAKDRGLEIANDRLLDGVVVALPAVENPETGDGDRSEAIHKPPKRRLSETSRWQSLRAEYSEMCGLLEEEPAYLLRKIPAVATLEKARSSKYARIFARRVERVLERFRKNREIENQDLVTAAELATYFGKPTRAMQMKLSRIRRSYEACFINRPEAGENRSRDDSYHYRTKLILPELREYGKM